MTIGSTFPITFFYGSLLGLMLVFISIEVLRYRVRALELGEDIAQRMPRVQGNFIEYVPLALILLGLLEETGAPTVVLHGLGITLLVARIMHAYGLGHLGSANYPRTVGTLLTFVVLAALSVAGLYASAQVLL